MSNTMWSEQYFRKQYQALEKCLRTAKCYRDVNRVRKDAMDLLRATPTLKPHVAQLTGSATNVLVVQLTGTMPIYYRGQQYNIPVTVWLTENYPYQPPIMYVVPTPDMVIQPRHKHVDSSGMVYLPYLSSWNYTHCNLIGVVTAAASVFGSDPPLRSVPKHQQQQQQQQQQPVQQAHQPALNRMQGRPVQSGGNVTSFEDPSAVVKRNLVAKITPLLQRELADKYRLLTHRIDEEMGKSSVRESAAQTAAARQDTLKRELARLQVETENLQKGCEQIEKWLAENDATDGELDIDVVTEPRDPLSKQLLYLVAEDAAIEDCLYYLEKGFAAGRIDLHTFLKSCRNLAREQYMKRATIRKVHERQRDRHQQ